MTKQETLDKIQEWQDVKDELELKVRAYKEAIRQAEQNIEGMKRILAIRDLEETRPKADWVQA